MKKAVLIISLSLFCLCSFSQNGDKQKEWGIKFSGFVKSNFWYDSRQILGSREDLFMFYPLNVLPDANGEDINAASSYNSNAIASRLTGTIAGPDAFGAKTTGVIEGDFTGMSNPDINGLRLRHAYGKFSWDKSCLLFGQYWHPMFVTEVFPNIPSLNTGAPFQPFIRNPQVSYTMFFNKININIAAISQRDNSNLGPVGYSSVYMRNAVMPNVHVQLQYKNENHVLGLAADYKWLKPRLVTDSLYKTDEVVTSAAAMAYWKYTKDLFAWRLKGIYGQNMTEHLLLGGYAIKSIDSTSMIETYTPTNHLFLWGNLTYGKKIQCGLFGGFAKNFGTSDENVGVYFSRGSDIDYLYRVSPSISFVSNNTKLSAELEYTSAAYGTPNTRGVVENSKEVDVFRVLVALFYFF